MSVQGEPGTAAPPGAPPDTPRGLPGGSAVRFVLVSSFAFIFDLAIVLALRYYVPAMPVWLAAAIAYMIVATAFYVVHEHYTFAHAQSRPDAGRLLRSIFAAGISIMTRVLVIGGLELIHEPGAADGHGALLTALYVAIGAAISMAVNYLLNRFWVFDRR